jgi:hypothetical protein
LRHLAAEVDDQDGFRRLDSHGRGLVARSASVQRDTVKPTSRLLRLQIMQVRLLPSTLR